MQFVYPTFLFALTAVAIPIIIHLFHFRRYKKIVFSDLRFLKQVQEQNKSKQKLKDLLVLLSRVLALIFLVLAFAQPFIPNPNASLLKGRKAVSLFIDNSFSMNNEGPEGNLLEAAKTKARAIVNAYGDADQFQIITQNFEGKHQRLVSKSDALAWIDEITISSSSASLSSIIKRQKQTLQKAGTDAMIQYVISDFQQYMCTAEPIEADSTLLLYLIPMKTNEQRNISVDSVWLSSPVIQLNQPITIHTRIHNYGETEAENIPIALRINGQQKGLQNINCPANQFSNVQFTYTPTETLIQGEISLTDHPIVFDDKMFFSFQPISTYNVLSINGGEPNKYITALFQDDATYLFTQAFETQLNYTAFSKQQLIILNEPKNLSSGLIQELLKYTSEGGQLCIIPPADNKDLSGLNNLLTALQLPLYGSLQKQEVKVASLNLQDALFKNVFAQLPRNMDLPWAKTYYSLQRNNASKGKSLLTLNTGDPFVWQASTRNGNVILFTTCLQTEWSNLPQHALYVPLMLKMAMGKQQEKSMYYTTGIAQWVQIGEEVKGDKLLRMWSNEQELILQTMQRGGKTVVYVDQPLTKAGNYNVAPQGTTKPLQYVAMNFARWESDMRTWNTDDLTAFANARPQTFVNMDDASVMKNTISNQLQGTALWRYCVWLALVFVLIEILLLRLLK